MRIEPMMEEDWMHLSQNTAFALAARCLRVIAEEGRIRPTGPWLMRW